ncbi:MAG: hypothetical protein ACJA1H_002511 [Glaciecola sp.]|jgi:hypothetical protein
MSQALNKKGLLYKKEDLFVFALRMEALLELLEESDCR